MSKYLFVLGQYYPIPSANGICVKALVENLKKRGDDVYILCLSNKDEHLVGEFGEEIYLMNDLYDIGKYKSLLNIRNWPIKSFEKVKCLEKKINLICSRHDIKHLIGVNKPFDCMLACKNVKESNSSFSFMAYYLDPLAFGTKPVTSSKKKWLEKGIGYEKMILEVADKVFVMRSHEKLYEKHFESSLVSNISFTDIPLIRVSKDEFVIKESADSEYVHILYPGNFIKKLREPFYFLELVSSIKINKKIIIDFYGEYDKKMMDKMKKFEHPSCRIVFHGRKEVSEINKIISSSDFLLNIGSKISVFIPSKLFQYISTGRPILHVSYDELDASLSYLNQYSNFIDLNMQNEFKFNQKNLIVFFESHLGVQITKDFIENSFYENTADHTIDLIKDVDCIE